VKKIVLFFVLIFLLAGCAGKSEPVMIASPEQNRAAYFRLEDIGNRLIPHMDKENRDRYKIVVAEKRAVNAYASPDHEIIVTKGALDTFSDEELWCILAHETAHLRLNHIDKQNILSGAMSMGFMVAGQFIPGVGLLNALANPVVSNAYSREQEIEADLAAVSALEHFHIQKEDYVKFLEHIADISLKEGRKDSFGLFSSHPTFKARIEAVREADSLEAPKDVEE
jgi:Zn-dependent protease with chaperone function